LDKSFPREICLPVRYPAIAFLYSLTLATSKQPYSVYAIYFATFTSLGLVTDPFFFYAFYQASKTWSSSAISWGWVIAVFWYLVTKIVKRIGLYIRDPWDILYLPVSIAFGFLHGFIKLYALWTWNEVRLIVS
jgi:hypothetical protein